MSVPGENAREFAKLHCNICSAMSTKKETINAANLRDDFNKPTQIDFDHMTNDIENLQSATTVQTMPSYLQC